MALFKVYEHIPKGNNLEEIYVEAEDYLDAIEFASKINRHYNSAVKCEIYFDKEQVDGESRDRE